MLADEELIGQLRAGLAEESLALEQHVTAVRPALAERVRRCSRAQRRRSRLRVAAGSAAVAALAIVTFAGPGGHGVQPHGQVAQANALTGVPVRLSGFTVPTPVHYTPTAKPCGLSDQDVHAASADGRACIQARLAEYGGKIHVPAGAARIVVDGHRVAVVHTPGNAYTHVVVFGPARAGAPAVLLSTRNVDYAQLVRIIASLVNTGSR